MRFGELRQYIPSDTVIALETEEQNKCPWGDCIDVAENNYLPKEYNDLEVVTFYNERYPVIDESGITVVVKKEREDNGKTCST